VEEGDMPVVIAVWPNNTFSVLQVPIGFSMSNLFWQLDAEANPTDAKLYILKPSGGWSHGTFDWKDSHRTDYEVGDKQYMKIKIGSGRLNSIEGALKRLKWPHNIVRTAYRSAFGRDPTEKPCLTSMTAEEIALMPAEPTQTYTVDEVRRMEPFCGVYFAFDEDGLCHYVGESETVSTRVTKSRPEIGARRIGIIKCDPHERRRIEAYFVAMLNPPGNGISTHRMKSKLHKQGGVNG
jgi:hypothetical protein